MTKAFLSIATLLALGAAGFAQAPATDSSNSSVEQQIQKSEQSMWEGWKNHDTKLFEQNLPEESIDVEGNAITKGKANIVKEVGAPDCNVNSFSLSDFAYTWIDKDAVIVTYTATVDAVCGGHKVPAKSYASSVWSKKDGKWVSPFHQESAVMPGAPPA